MRIANTAILGLWGLMMLVPANVEAQTDKTAWRSGVVQPMRAAGTHDLEVRSVGTVIQSHGYSTWRVRLTLTDGRRVVLSVPSSAYSSASAHAFLSPANAQVLRNRILDFRAAGSGQTTIYTRCLIEEAKADGGALFSLRRYSRVRLDKAAGFHALDGDIPWILDVVEHQATRDASGRAHWIGAVGVTDTLELWLAPHPGREGERLVAGGGPVAGSTPPVRFDGGVWEARFNGQVFSTGYWYDDASRRIPPTPYTAEQRGLVLVPGTVQSPGSPFPVIMIFPPDAAYKLNFWITQDGQRLAVELINR